MADPALAHGNGSDVFDVVDRKAERSCTVKRIAFLPCDRSLFRLTQINGGFHERLQNSFQVKAERLITLSTSAVAVCCCNDFATPMLAQLLQQPRIFDCDYSLVGKSRNQLDLTVTEGLNL